MEVRILLPQPAPYEKIRKPQGDSLGFFLSGAMWKLGRVCYLNQN